MRRLLLQSLMISMGFYAHSGDVLSAGTSGSVTPGYLTGTVYVAKPQVGANVVLKSVDGAVIGSAITDSTGQYQIPSDYSGLVFAEAKSASGQKYYGIGRDGLVNVTPLSSIVLTEWFKAKKQTVSTIFSKFSTSTPLPSDYDLEAFGENVFISASGYTGATYVDLIHDPIGPEAQQMLSNAKFNTATGNFAIRVGNAFKGSGTITAKASSNGVVLSGKSVDIHHNVNEKPQSKRVAFSTAVSAAGVSGSNQSWMGADMAFIGNKRLADIAIPGTHDSGTARVKGALGDTAKTQDKSIGEQLEDGIRYLDLRVLGIDPTSSSSRSSYCPVVSDYYIYHNSEKNNLSNFSSFRLNEVLADIKAFVSNPENANEIVILDFQNLGYVLEGGTANTRDIQEGGVRWQGRLFESVQDYLDGYIITRSNEWSNKTISELASVNTGIGARGKVILLVSDEYINNPASSNTESCNGSTRPELWYSREQRVNGVYKSRESYSMGLSGDIFAQLSSAYAMKNARNADYENYKRIQSSGYLNALNFAPRPSDTWYFGAAIFPNRLTQYSYDNVNKPFNFNGVCSSGMIGKYAWAGQYGNQNGPAGAFNKANIFMIDKYEGYSDIWVNVDYNENNGKWVQTSVTGFVDFIRNLNKPQPYTGVAPKTINSMQDEACLETPGPITWTTGNSTPAGSTGSVILVNATSSQRTYKGRVGGSKDQYSGMVRLDSSSPYTSPITLPAKSLCYLDTSIVDLKSAKADIPVFVVGRNPNSGSGGLFMDVTNPNDTIFNGPYQTGNNNISTCSANGQNQCASNKWASWTVGLVNLSATDMSGGIRAGQVELLQDNSWDNGSFIYFEGGWLKRRPTLNLLLIQGSVDGGGFNPGTAAPSIEQIKSAPPCSNFLKP